MIEQKFRGILAELSDYAPKRDRDQVIEARAQQVIASAHNLIRLLREAYDDDTAEDLIRRLGRAITTGDEDKFNRRIRGLKEARNRKPTP